ncbi:MAG: hypothetical protein O6947_01935 [Acidobacteria bacterium]|nr:hypothetical protein [Acidobacteriota bacterium]
MKTLFLILAFALSPGLSAAPAAEAAKIQSLSAGESDLRTAFNADSDKVRLVLILSPT